MKSRLLIIPILFLAFGSLSWAECPEGTKQTYKGCEPVEEQQKGDQAAEEQVEEIVEEKSAVDTTVTLEGLEGFTLEEIEIDTEAIGGDKPPELAVITHKFDDTDCRFLLSRIAADESHEPVIASGYLSIVDGRVRLTGSWRTGGYSSPEAFSDAQIVIDEIGGLVGSLEVFHLFDEAGKVPHESVLVDLSKADGEFVVGSPTTEFNFPIDGWANGRLELQSCGIGKQEGPNILVDIGDFWRGGHWIYVDITVSWPTEGASVRVGILADFPPYTFYTDSKIDLDRMKEIKFKFDARTLKSIDLDAMSSCLAGLTRQRQGKPAEIFLTFFEIFPRRMEPEASPCIFRKLDEFDQNLVKTLVKDLEYIIAEGTKGKTVVRDDATGEVIGSLDTQEIANWKKIAKIIRDNGPTVFQ